ncbi:MAG: flavin reductase family protein [Clostridiales bacterium]|nr:flavin reductase family protein [Clostridiales bacterium]
MEINPNDVSQKENHLLLDSIVCPRPIFFVSTLNKQNIVNLAPYSMSTIASTSPAMVCFSVALRPNGEEKDTLANIRETGEFVVNTVTAEILDDVLIAAGDYNPGISELEYVNLSTLPSVTIAPPRVKESPVHLECKLHQIVELGAHSLIIGRIQLYHIADEVYSGDDVDTAKLNIIGRMRKSSFVRTSDVFSNENLWKLYHGS